MRRGYELFTRFSRDKKITYHVLLWKQPTARYWIAELYHWYEIRIEKVPGVKLIQNIINRRRIKKGWELYIPVWANRDVRCHYLTRKNRQDIIEFEVTEEKYNSLK
jgi:hypothetical protein